METKRFEEKTHAKNLVFTGDLKGNMGKSIKAVMEFPEQEGVSFEYASRA
jgi:hypothetical protein